MSEPGETNTSGDFIRHARHPIITLGINIGARESSLVRNKMRKKKEKCPKTLDLKRESFCRTLMPVKARGASCRTRFVGVTFTRIPKVLLCRGRARCRGESRRGSTHRAFRSITVIRPPVPRSAVDLNENRPTPFRDV